jgi:hypothetical protein
MRSALTLIACATIGALTFGGDARAIVGAASEHGPLESRVMMVLTSNKRSAAFCSAVVISRDVVLTAAHCVGGVGNTVLHFRASDGRPVTLPIKAIAIHPDYRPNAIAKRERSIDIALARVVQPLPDRFVAAPLASQSSIAIGDRFRAAGYGLARENVGASGGLFRWGLVAARGPISSVLLWAEDPEHQGLGACTGDSGGPVFAAGDDTVVAITAWTTGARGGHCGGLTQGALVAPQRSWIDATMDGWKAR